MKQSQVTFTPDVLPFIRAPSYERQKRIVALCGKHGYSASSYAKVVREGIQIVVQTSRGYLVVNAELTVGEKRAFGIPCTPPYFTSLSHQRRGRTR